MQAILNQSVRRDPGYRGLFDAAEYERVEQFYTAHPDLKPTPLRSLPALAARLGLGEVLVKDESRRWGVEAFKIAGVRYAVEQLDLHTLKQGLACATAGNHGRAVARAARDLGVPCTVFLPAARPDAHATERATRAARVSAMREDRATVIETTGSYEEAVGLAAAHGDKTGATVVSDTAWPGYERIPRLIMCGYTRLFDEAALNWSTPPDIVIVQGGVGGLVCAAANWFAFRFGASRPFLIASEPDNAACLLESARAGRLVNLIEDRLQPPGQQTCPANDHGRSAVCGAVACGLAFDSRRDRCVRLRFGPTRARGDRHASVRWIRGCGHRSGTVGCVRRCGHDGARG